MEIPVKGSSQFLIAVACFTGQLTRPVAPFYYPRGTACALFVLQRAISRQPAVSKGATDMILAVPTVTASELVSLRLP